MIRLGSKVRDTLTGFKGIATARTEWMNGCVRYEIEPEALHEGRPIKPAWFDEQRVAVIPVETPALSVDVDAKTGGPQRDPSRPGDPS